MEQITISKRIAPNYMATATFIVSDWRNMQTITETQMVHDDSEETRAYYAEKGEVVSILPNGNRFACKYTVTYIVKQPTIHTFSTERDAIAFKKQLKTQA